VIFTIERMTNDVAALGGGLRGRVSICASPSAIAESLLDDIASFMREPANTNIHVDIEERLSVDLVRQLREGSTSIGVCWDNVDLQGLQNQPYRHDRLAIAVPPDHPLAQEKMIGFEQTLSFEHVGLPPNTSVHTMLRQAAASVGKTISYRAIVSNFDATFRVAAAGLGISVVPVEVAETYRRSLGLRIIPLTDAWSRRRFIICFKDFDALQPAAQRLVEYLRTRAIPAPISPA
jgi:DNA-binding transcriptional LysR family regulator